MKTKLIFGMIPWMFWTLVGVTVFTLFGPELVALARGGDAPPEALQFSADVSKLTLTAKIDNALLFGVASETVMSIPHDHTELTIFTGKGKVRVSMKDGAVTADPDVVMDEAARRFWQAVTSTFPLVNQRRADRLEKTRTLLALRGGLAGIEGVIEFCKATMESQKSGPLFDKANMTATRMLELPKLINDEIRVIETYLELKPGQSPF